MSSKNSNLSLYNSKYLKYKNKYLSLKKMFGGTKSDHNEVDKLNVIACLPNGEERSVAISKKEEVVTAMARELGVRPTQIVVSFTDNVIGLGLTAEDCGIVNSSRLTVTFIVDFRKYPEVFDINFIGPQPLQRSNRLSGELYSIIKCEFNGNICYVHAVMSNDDIDRPHDGRTKVSYSSLVPGPWRFNQSEMRFSADVINHVNDNTLANWIEERIRIDPTCLSEATWNTVYSLDQEN